MAENLNEFIPTRRSLLTRLKNWEDQESWRAFFDTYWKLIYGVATEAGLSAVEAQEVVQETIITVAKNFKEAKYQYDPRPGSFKAWLLQTTRWRIHDQFRKRQREAKVGAHPSARQSDSSDRTSTIERVPDSSALSLDAIWERDWERNLMDAAIERVKQQVRPKVYQTFDLLVLKEWPAREVAEKLGVNFPQIYYAKRKVSSLIKKEIRRLEARGI